MTPRQVQALRKRLRFTQSELARQLGVGRSAVNNWERGKQKPLPMAVKFMELLKTLHDTIKGDLLIRNPVSRVKSLAEDNEQMRVLTFEEQRGYLSKASQPLRDIATLMLETA